MSYSSGAAQFKLTYELSPILFVGGSAAGNVPGGIVPIISYTQGEDYDLGLLSASNDDIDLDQFFAYFTPMSGATLADNEIGSYPFINQATAANAVIANPLRVSLLMTCPVRADSNYAKKLATMSALKSTIDQHVGSGGLFNVATPAFLYTNCILVSLRDVSQLGPELAQAQYQWQWDFVQPLVTLQALAQAANTSMGKINSQTQNSGDPPGSNPAQNSVGQPASGTGPSVVPAARPLGGASAAAPTSQPSFAIASSQTGG